MRVGASYPLRLLALPAALAFGLGGSGIVSRAQTATLNGKQRLLAGEPLPVNAAADYQARRLVAAGAARPTAVPGRLVVKMQPGAGDAELGTAVVHIGGRVSGRPYADFSIVTVDPDRDLSAAAADLSAQPGVLYAEPDPILYPAHVPNDPLYKYQWNLQKLGMERTWDINPGADTSLVVAIIDGGVAYLDKGNVREAPDLVGTNFVSPHDFIWDDDEPVDLDGHGTHVTGVVAERAGNGMGAASMAYNVSIMPIKVVSGFWDEVLGAPNIGTASTLAEAIRYAADNGAKVINLSLGFSDGSTAVKDAIGYAIDKGVVLAAAAGNSGGTGSPDFYPAAYGPDFDGLLAVAAVDLNLQRAYYSNINPYVEIAAPGGDTTADLNDDGYGDGILQQTLDLDLVPQGVFDQFGYFFVEGTSSATPHVSGLAALLITQGVTTPKAVEKVIERFATDEGAPGRDNDTGYGVINPRATIRGLGLSQ
jgi:serine protease